MKEQVSNWYQTLQHWKRETKGVIYIFKPWKDGKNFEPEMFGLSWSEEGVLKVSWGMCSPHLCVLSWVKNVSLSQYGSRRYEEEWSPVPPDTVPRMTYVTIWHMWTDSSSFLLLFQLWDQLGLVMVAASPILNGLPVVLPMPDFFTTPRSFLVTGGAMASRVLTTNQRTGDISNHACQVLRNHEVGPKKPAVASFQVYVTWLQNLSFWFLILGYTLVVRYNR